ncbi:hypothetical protein D3C73_967560 [compost metagenome]
MRSAQGYPQPCTASRYGRRADGGDQQASFAQHLRQAQCLCAVADQDRLDRSRAVHQLQADLRGTLAELPDQPGQVLTAPGFAAQQLKALERGAGQCRRLAGGIDVRPGELHQCLDQVIAARNEGARCAASLAQRTDQHGHVIDAQAKGFDDSAALCTQGTQAVSVVDHQPGTTRTRDFGQCRQVGQVTVHAEHTVGDHQGIAAGLAQAVGQADCIVVQVTVEAGTTEQTAIEQRSMVEAVLQHRIALPHQRRDGPEVGHVAGRKQQGTRATGQFGQRLFDLMMRRAVADHQMRGSATDTPTLGAGLPGGNHLRVVGQAQVVITAESQQRLAVDHYVRPLRAL